MFPSNSTVYALIGKNSHTMRRGSPQQMLQLVTLVPLTMVIPTHVRFLSKPMRYAKCSDNVMYGANVDEDEHVLTGAWCDLPTSHPHGQMIAP